MSDRRKTPDNRKKKHSRSRNLRAAEDSSQTSTPGPNPRQQMLSRFVGELNSGEPVSEEMRRWWLSQY